jgi:hypothetical protein
MLVHFRLLRCYQLRTGKQAFRCLSTVATAPKEPSLSGTVPNHSAYLYLHAKQSPQNLPKIIDSDLYLKLKSATAKWEEKCLVNLRFDSVVTDQEDGQLRSVGEEEYEATLHVGRLETHSLRVSPSTLDSTLSFIQSRIQNFRNPLDSPTLVDPRQVYLYVCTHGAVDCRCGEYGPNLLEALSKELQRLKEGDLLKDRFWKDVRIMETCHVGGHKYVHSNFHSGRETDYQ